MVQVRDARGDTVANDLGVVKLHIPVIAAGDKDAAESIERAAFEASRAELKIAWVLVQYGREHRGGHEGPDAGVRVDRGIALAVALQALAVGRVAVASLPDQSDASQKRNGNRIGHGLGGEQKLGLHWERRDATRPLDHEVVWQDEK